MAGSGPSAGEKALSLDSDWPSHGRRLRSKFSVELENRCTIAAVFKVRGDGVETRMNWKRFILGVLTALAMLVLTYVLPRGGGLRDASLVQFPMTVGVWAIFVLLFVKLK
jgi:hypothetical protein